MFVRMFKSWIWVYLKENITNILVCIKRRQWKNNPIVPATSRIHCCAPGSTAVFWDPLLYSRHVVLQPTDRDREHLVSLLTLIHILQWDKAFSLNCDERGERFVGNYISVDPWVKVTCFNSGLRRQPCIWLNTHSLIKTSNKQHRDPKLVNEKLKMSLWELSPHYLLCALCLAAVWPPWSFYKQPS